MTEIPWSFPGKAAINFRNEICSHNTGEDKALWYRPKTIIVFD